MHASSSFDPKWRSPSRPPTDHKRDRLRGHHRTLFVTHTNRIHITSTDRSKQAVGRSRTQPICLWHERAGRQRRVPTTNSSRTRSISPAPHWRPRSERSARTRSARCSRLLNRRARAGCDLHCRICVARRDACRNIPFDPCGMLGGLCLASGLTRGTPTRRRLKPQPHVRPSQVVPAGVNPLTSITRSVSASVNTHTLPPTPTFANTAFAATPPVP
jgi:hypothetical protein